MLTVTLDATGRAFDPKIKLGTGPGEEYFSLHLPAKGEVPDSREEIVLFLEREQVGQLWNVLAPVLLEAVEA